METKQKKNYFNKKILGTLLACAIALVAIVPGVLSKSTPVVASTIVLDINPSLEIDVDEDEKVLSIKALNNDAKKIIGDLDFVGSDIEVTINALVASMLQHGYLTDIKNSILVSVDGKALDDRTYLEKRISSIVTDILKQNNFDGAILSQDYTVTKDTEKLMDLYSISAGKATLIHQLVTSNNLYVPADLAKLSIQELTLLTTSSRNQVEGVTNTGTPSTSSYIGTTKVLDIALKHAGITTTQVVNKDIEFDYDDGVMVYDVEFNTSTTEYEYEINALNGNIMKVEKDVLETDDQDTDLDDDIEDDLDDRDDHVIVTPTPSTLLTTTKVWDIVLKHAGVSGTLYEKEIDLDQDDNEYEIEFKTDTHEYEYEVNATTGVIISHDKEVRDFD